MWIDVPGYEGLYMVSDTGEVKSLDRLDVRGHRIKGRLLSPNKHYVSGYLSVQLCRNGKSKRINIHSIMCISFLDKDYLSKGLECNHKDGIKYNNVLSNLELVTQSENGQHAYDTGLNIHSPLLGEKHGMSKLSDIEVKEIYLKYHTLNITQKELGSMYNVSRVMVSDITRGKAWKHLQHDV